MIRLRCATFSWLALRGATLAIVALSLTAGAHATPVVLLDENLDAATDPEAAEILNVTGPTGFAQVMDGAVPVNSALPGVTAFGGFGGGDGVQVVLDVETAIGAGPGGAEDDFITINSSVTGTPDFSFQGLQAAFTLPIQTFEFAETLDVSVDVQAPDGTPLSLRVESPFTSQNNGFELLFTADGTVQPIGGNLGLDFTDLGVFDPTATLNVVVAVPTGGGTIPLGESSISVNNFLVTTAVPEPTSAGLAVLSALGCGFVRRRR